MAEPELKTILAGKYQVIRALGTGGMGEVFEVLNVLTGKRAAVKRLHADREGADSGRTMQRVLHEARAVSRIRHRNVVDVYDVVADDTDVYLIMELLEGESLAKRRTGEAIPIEALVGWFCAAMRGVAAGHAVGVVHRDLKPDNLFMAVGDDGAPAFPVVIDFGISKVFDAEGRSTNSGVTMGTPRYVSYEQLRGANRVDARTDVYAFGVMLYEAVTGRAPYDAHSFGEQAIRFITTVPAAVRALNPLVPEPLSRAIEAAIARDREDRPATMSAFIALLAPFRMAEAYPEPFTAYGLGLEVSEAADHGPNAGVTTLRTGESAAGGPRAPLAEAPEPSEPPATASRSFRSLPPPSRQRRMIVAAAVVSGVVALVALHHSGRPVAVANGETRARPRAVAQPLSPASAIAPSTSGSSAPMTAADATVEQPSAELAAVPSAKSADRVRADFAGVRRRSGRATPRAQPSSPALSEPQASAPAVAREPEKVSKPFLRAGSLSVGEF